MNTTGKRPTLSIVIPVYNEQESIGEVLRAIEANVNTPHEVLVVYDFEEDSTVPVVTALQPEFPAVRLHRNDIGRGVLYAIRSGMDHALGDFVLVSMADGSDDARDIDAMVALGIDGAAVVAASRYAPGGAQVGGPKLKARASRTAGMLLHVLGGFPIHDPTNNFKLYDRSFLESITIESTRGFELGLELTVKAHGAGLGIKEVPTTWRDRTIGESHFHVLRLLPGYLRWFALGLSYRLPRRVQRVLSSRLTRDHAFGDEPRAPRH